MWEIWDLAKGLVAVSMRLSVGVQNGSEDGDADLVIKPLDPSEQATLVRLFDAES